MASSKHNDLPITGDVFIDGTTINSEYVTNVSDTGINKWTVSTLSEDFFFSATSETF